ncbi:MAG: hypothetical protein AAF750_18490 [Planctomycetota bacterium]
MPHEKPDFQIPGQRVRIPRWVFGERYIVQVEVDAVLPDEDPTEPCLEPAALRHLDQLQRWINEGRIEELEKAGALYVRKSA